MNFLPYKKIREHWFSALPLLIILIIFLLAYKAPLLWEKEEFRVSFFKIGFYLCGIISALWMFQHYTLLFEKGEYLRSLIICVGATTVFVWTYKHKITFRMDLFLLFLCGLYGIIYHKWIRPNKVMITFFLLILLRYIGMLWSVDKSFAWEDSFSDKVYFLLFAPIVCLGFRIKEREYISFVTLAFKLFLLLLTLNISTYIFVHKAIGLPFFSFLTLNKGYMDYTGHILAWTFFKHPSFISWVMFSIWGLSILVWRKDKKHIPLFEIILYGLLLFCFAFIVQARIIIIGFPLGILLLYWLHFSKNWSSCKRILIETGILLIGVLGIYLLVSHTSYFSDPIREKMLSSTVTAITEHPIFGNGTIYEKIIAENTVGQWHIHNDFLATLIDLGVLGLILLLLWIGFCYQKAILDKDHSIVYCLMMFLLLMNTDVMLNFYPGILITIPFLIFVFFKEENLFPTE